MVPVRSLGFINFASPKSTSFMCPKVNIKNVSLFVEKHGQTQEKRAHCTDRYIMYSTGQHLNLYDNKGNSFLASRLLSTSLLYRTLLVCFFDGILRGWKRRGLTTFPCVKLASQAGKPSQLTGWTVHFCQIPLVLN